MTTLQCLECKRAPEDIQEYRDAVSDSGEEEHSDDIQDEDVRHFVIHNEGTYNPATNVFWCTECYLNKGAPLGLARDI